MESQIALLAFHARKTQELNKSVTRWFHAQGLLDADLDGVINDLLIDMMLATFNANETVRLIESEMAKRSGTNADN